MLLGIVTNESLDKESKLLFKQLKNRYGDRNMFSNFFLSVNKAQMRIFDTGESLNENSADYITEFERGEEIHNSEILKLQKQSEENIFSTYYKMNKMNSYKNPFKL